MSTWCCGLSHPMKRNGWLIFVIANWSYRRTGRIIKTWCETLHGRRLPACPGRSIDMVYARHGFVTPLMKFLSGSFWPVFGMTGHVSEICGFIRWFGCVVADAGFVAAHPKVCDCLHHFLMLFDTWFVAPMPDLVFFNSMLFFEFWFRFSYGQCC